MIGMVLAAGAGRRLRPYTDTLPKALVPVDGETTIMDISLRNLAEVDLREVVVVVGYAAEAVEERQAELEQRHGVSSPWCTTTRPRIGTTPTPCGSRATTSRGALLVNGDTVHPVSRRADAAGRAADPDILLAVDNVKTLADEEMKVILDADGH